MPATLRDRLDAAILAQPSILVDEDEAAILLRLSPSTLKKLRGLGQFPPPVDNLGERCVRFLRSDLELWAASGCPDEAVFRRIKAARG